MNYGLELLIKKDEHLDEVKKEKEWQVKAWEDLKADKTISSEERQSQQQRIGDPIHYNDKEHQELKDVIAILHYQLSLTRLTIKVDLDKKQLKTIVTSEYISYKDKIWRVPHNEIIALGNANGKGMLNLTEVKVKEDETDKKPGEKKVKKGKKGKTKVPSLRKV